MQRSGFLVEAVAVVALVIGPWPVTWPIAVPLLAIASISRWSRGLTWAERVRPRAELVVGGVVAGAVAAAVAVPAYRAFDVTALEWWLVPAASGELGQLAGALAISLASAIALELALRGWLVERVLELSPGPASLPLAVAAAVEALAVPGAPGERIGIAVFGLGLGTLYIAAGRNVVAPIAARGTFVVAAVLAQATGLV